LGNLSSLATLDLSFCSSFTRYRRDGELEFFGNPRFEQLYALDNDREQSYW
jgi:hypothetical protein